MQSLVRRNTAPSAHHLTGQGSAVVPMEADDLLLTDPGTSDSADQWPEGLASCVTRSHAQEIARYGKVELHVICAILGGVASQEAVKLLTHQYVCINNTYVYNGVAGVGCVYEF